MLLLPEEVFLGKKMMSLIMTTSSSLRSPDSRSLLVPDSDPLECAWLRPGGAS